MSVKERLLMAWSVFAALAIFYSFLHAAVFAERLEFASAYPKVIDQEEPTCPR